MLEGFFVGFDFFPNDVELVDIPLSSISFVGPENSGQQLVSNPPLWVVHEEFYWEWTGV
jgi:hypothetical protein